MSVEIHESGEMYLKTILILLRKTGQVRSVDIANELNYSKPSISNAMKLLRKNDYVLMSDDGYITLTGKGREIAESLYERYAFLTDFLTALGVDQETAAQDACRIEHIISQESFDKLREHVDMSDNVRYVNDG